MENNSVSKIVVGFFMIILGLALIAAVANGSALVTSKTNVVDEAIDISTARNASGGINITASNFTITNVPTGWKVDECPISSVTYGNATEDYTDTTDYNFYASSGILQVLESAEANDNNDNTTLIDYTYCPDAYVNLAWGRTVLNLVAGFFALAILGLGLGLFYSVAKDAGIIGK